MEATSRKKPGVDAGLVLGKAVARAAERLGVSRRELAAAIGISEATLSRVTRGKPIDPESKAGELAILFVRLFRSLDAMVGGDEAQARAWLRADNAHLGAPPVDLVLRAEGLVRVIGYLDALRGKV
jgi:transcriptional regulator with XRE-family HTH domain